MRMRTVRTALVAAIGVATVAACSSTGSGDPSPTPTPLPTDPQIVRILANPKDCDAQPLLVIAGSIKFTATSTATIPISVSLFAPQDGAFTKRLARIRVLKPNETQTMSADLAQGAYEVACGTEVLESRKRITAL